MVRVKFGQYEAEIEGYRWTCEDLPALEDLLNAMLHPLGPSGADPYPDYTAAEDAAKRLNGEIVYADKLKPLPPGVIP